MDTASIASSSPVAELTAWLLAAGVGVGVVLGVAAAETAADDDAVVGAGVGVDVDVEELAVLFDCATVAAAVVDVAEDELPLERLTVQADASNPSTRTSESVMARWRKSPPVLRANMTILLK
ncbi:MAG TPA: hypothetical protein VKU87_03545 [Thermomicrobiaceae bacterium]|nr:hypothetical protein [Thermomicrobiaceae bacterium]